MPFYMRLAVKFLSCGIRCVDLSWKTILIQTLHRDTHQYVAMRKYLYELRHSDSENRHTPVNYRFFTTRITFEAQGLCALDMMPCFSNEFFFNYGLIR